MWCSGWVLVPQNPISSIWLFSSARHDLFDLLPTLMMPLSSRNGSSFTMQLPLGTVLPSNKCFFSLANDWSCTILNDRYCASWSALTLIESCNWITDAVFAVLFNQISLILISRAITFSFCYNSSSVFEVLPRLHFLLELHWLYGPS